MIASSTLRKITSLCCIHARWIELHKESDLIIIVGRQRWVSNTAGSNKETVSRMNQQKKVGSFENNEPTLVGTCYNIYFVCICIAEASLLNFKFLPWHCWSSDQFFHEILVCGTIYAEIPVTSPICISAKLYTYKSSSIAHVHCMHACISGP